MKFCLEAFYEVNKRFCAMAPTDQMSIGEEELPVFIAYAQTPYRGFDIL
jgi:hypothetical protein